MQFEREELQAVFARGDAVDLLVKVLYALQQVVEDLVRLPLRLVQCLGSCFSSRFFGG